MKSKVVITNVDDDGKLEVIVYDEEGEKVYTRKVDEFETEIYG